jgi:hypothetical protein
MSILASGVTEMNQEGSDMSDEINCSYCDGPTRTGNRVEMTSEHSCLVICGECDR